MVTRPLAIAVRVALSVAFTIGEAVALCRAGALAGTLAATIAGTVAGALAATIPGAFAGAIAISLATVSIPIATGCAVSTRALVGAAPPLTVPSTAAALAPLGRGYRAFRG